MSDPSDILIIRADAGGRHGIGHVMRMIALAQAWQNAGHEVEMVCASCPSGVIHQIQDESIAFTQINTTEGSKADARKTLERANKAKCKWIVLDGYHFGETYQNTVKQAGYRLLCVDDYGHCKRWFADIVLNQNLHAFDLNSKFMQQSPKCTFILGPRYALLRKEFGQEASSTERIFNPHSAHLLITFGGVDQDNWTEKIVRALLQSPHNIPTLVVLGAGNPHIDKIKELVKSTTKPIQIVQNAENMANIYRTSDCIVSAAGSSSYEWLRYRLPALVFVIADNQKPLAPYLSRIPNVELFSKDATNVNAIKTSLDRLIKLGKSKATTPQIVDALGANRVVSAMLDA